MIEDTRLKIFDKVAVLGNFTLAARELGISQPAVSQNIAELEKQLGVQLFVRERGMATLTDKGRLFKEYSDQILHWYRAADRAFGGPNVFDSEDSHPKAVTLKLDDDSEARIWSALGDIHISIRNK